MQSQVCEQESLIHVYIDLYVVSSRVVMPNISKSRVPVPHFFSG